MSGDKPPRRRRQRATKPGGEIREFKRPPQPRHAPHDEEVCDRIGRGEGATATELGWALISHGDPTDPYFAFQATAWALRAIDDLATHGRLLKHYPDGRAE